MNIEYVRASSVNTYGGCEFQYFLEDVLNIPSQSGKKALLGTIVHHVLEIMARAKKNNHSPDKFTDAENLLRICWDRYEKEEGHNFDLKPADYRFCTRTIDKVIGTAYDPMNLNVIDVEKRFQLPLKTDGFSFDFYDIMEKTQKSGYYELRGTSDLITEIDSDTLEIVDWKTGSRKDWNTGKLKDYEYLSSKDLQLRMYDLAMSLVYPQYKTRLLTIHFINDGGPFTVTFDDAQRKETLEILRGKINDIRDNWMPARMKEVNPKDARWKCKNVCYFGKTKGPSGMCHCDNVYSYMVHNGIEETMSKASEIRNNKKDAEKSSTSNRRNVY